MALPESEFSRDVSLSILEDQNTRLENLDSIIDLLLTCRLHLERVEVQAVGLGKVHISFFAGRYTAI